MADPDATPDPSGRRVVCIGGATIDRTYRTLEPLIPGTSNPAGSRTGFGGVARNVAECLSRLDVPTALVSVVGDDAGGAAIRRHLDEAGIDTAHLATRAPHATAGYVAVLGPDRALAFGLADMAILDTLSPDDLHRARPLLDRAAWVFADCNLPPSTLSALVDLRPLAGFRLAVDAVSTAKALRLRAHLPALDLLFLNAQEAAALLQRPADHPPADLAAALHARGAGAVVLTLGAQGVLVAGDGPTRHLPGFAAVPVDVTGAGDALIAGTLSRLLDGAYLAEACRTGQAAACLTLEAEPSVRPDLSRDLIARTLSRLDPSP